MGRKKQHYTTTTELHLADYPDLTPTARLAAVWIYAYSLKKKKHPTKEEIQEGIQSGERTFERAWKQLLTENIVQTTKMEHGRSARSM